jgi:CBS domain-containing protein
MRSNNDTAEHLAASGTPHELFDREARDVMTPGVVTIAEDASLDQVTRALGAHHVHAILVIGIEDGMPLGWVTARGLLPWLNRDRALATAKDAICEEVKAVAPSADVRAALDALSLPNTSRLLVQRGPDAVPEGVITDYDLAVAARP